MGDWTIPVSLPDEQEAFGHWRPRWRVAGLVALFALGVAMALHATYMPEWYNKGPVTIDWLGRVVGTLLAVNAIVFFVIVVAEPWSKRGAFRSPLVIGIDRNTLYLERRGRQAGLSSVVRVSGDYQFSSGDQFLADPEKLADAIEKVISLMKVRLKPYVLVMPFDDGRPRRLSKGERALISDALSQDSVLDFAFIRSDSPYFDIDLPRRVSVADTE